MVDETGTARVASGGVAAAPRDVPPAGRTAAAETRAPSWWRLLAEALRAYRLIAAMGLKSSLAYRASFAVTAFGNFAGSALDFVAILLMFTRVDALGGFSLPEVAFLYGTSATAFGITDLVMGSTERLGRRVRDGTLDALMVRPVPVLAQVAADQFALRRLGRILQGALLLGYAIAAVDVDWTPARIVLLPVMLLSGAAIFASVFVAAAAFQFWSQDATEVQSAFTYGGTTLLQYPPNLFAKDLVRGVIYVVPLAFVNWLPALYVLGRPLPDGLPDALAFCSPAVALLCCCLAGTAWRAGVKSYRSTGS